MLRPAVCCVNAAAEINVLDYILVVRRRRSTLQRHTASYAVSTGLQSLLLIAAVTNFDLSVVISVISNLRLLLITKFALDLSVVSDLPN